MALDIECSQSPYYHAGPGGPSSSGHGFWTSPDLCPGRLGGNLIVAYRMLDFSVVVHFDVGTRPVSGRSSKPLPIKV